MTDWTRLRVVDLREELKRRGLSYNGLKGELVARLTEAENEPVQDESEIEDAPAQDESVATEPIPAEPDVEAPEIAVEEPVEDNVSQEESKEKEKAPSAPDESEENGAGRDSLPEETKNSVSDDADPTPVTGQEAEPQPTEQTPADEPMQDTVEEANTTEDLSPAQPIEGSIPAPDSQESLKRKRRSLTPPPSEEAIARKRARPDESATNGQTAPQVIFPEDQEIPQTESLPEDMKVDEQTPEKPRVQPRVQPQEQTTHETRDSENSPPTKPRDYQQEMEYERDVAPAVHPATSALYIKNFMRPLRPHEVQAHLADLATPRGDVTDDDVIVDFFLDQIRTHAFATFKSTSAASRVRTALHDTVWPNESNRKPLWVDFVPPEKVRGWIETEESSGRRGPRWEVVYEDGPNGEIEARFESGNASFSRQGNRPPPGPAANSADSIPLGPRGYRDVGGPPTGPRAVRPGSGPGPRPPPSAPGGDTKQTSAQPAVYYQPVSEDLARRRIENMRSFYTSDRNRDVGREINRYSFESGDNFVDRGKEIFEGIRPPHRDGGNFDRDRRGFGGGGGRRGRGGRGGRGSGFRPRSDRYLPGQGSGRDDRRSRFNDNDVGRDSPRNDDDRESFRSRDTRDRRY
ncbi:hypothetical protein BGZ61DRAFT_81622 [Ilyonectria robusta]|uniref:uncharacterized protein n=1 Tax=Ilyonectria robusta TaxID=1079257 RepID=UPI001E8DBE65|nr:uncharacterized protein BGZ61DRAFT_81622 [Ilyonectria robusta]KAH8735571.1 hypothetical protein BGZ61DRAFT_81622 [Ilyonectria robusta]